MKKSYILFLFMLIFLVVGPIMGDPIWGPGGGGGDSRPPIDFSDYKYAEFNEDIEGTYDSQKYVNFCIKINISGNAFKNAIKIEIENSEKKDYCFVQIHYYKNIFGKKTYNKIGKTKSFSDKIIFDFDIDDDGWYYFSFYSYEGKPNKTFEFKVSDYIQETKTLKGGIWNQMPEYKNYEVGKTSSVELITKEMLPVYFLFLDSRIAEKIKKSEKYPIEQIYDILFKTFEVAFKYVLKILTKSSIISILAGFLLSAVFKNIKEKTADKSVEYLAIFRAKLEEASLAEGIVGENGTYTKKFNKDVFIIKEEKVNRTLSFFVSLVLIFFGSSNPITLTYNDVAFLGIDGKLLIGLPRSRGEIKLYE